MINSSCFPLLRSESSNALAEAGQVWAMARVFITAPFVCAGEWHSECEFKVMQKALFLETFHLPVTVLRFFRAVLYLEQVNRSHRLALILSSITGVLQPLYRDHKRKNSVTELGSVTVYFPSNYYFVESTPPSREGVQGDPILS